MIEVRYHESARVLQAFACKSTFATASPFERPEWFELIADTDIKPLIVIANHGKDALALPLMQDGDRLTVLRNWYSFTWRPMIAAGNARTALLEAIARDLRTRTHHVRFEQMPDEGGEASGLASAFASAGWRVETWASDCNHVLEVGGRSFAQYWATRPGPLRTTLKRRGGGIETEILSAFDPESWLQYEQIYGASWKPTEGAPQMLRAFARREGEAGRLRLAIARHEGLPVAAQFWTIEDGTAFIHKLAHRQSHRHLSAGTVLSAAMFARAIDTDRASIIDFGTGDEPYKRDWMETVRPRYTLDCIDASQPRAWIEMARRTARRLRPTSARKLASPIARG